MANLIRFEFGVEIPFGVVQHGVCFYGGFDLHMGAGQRPVFELAQHFVRMPLIAVLPDFPNAAYVVAP